MDFNPDIKNFDELIKVFDLYFGEPNLPDIDHNNVCSPVSKPTTSPKKRRRSKSISNKVIEPKQNPKQSTIYNGFDTPQHLWSLAKHRRFKAVKRLAKKRREGCFGYNERNTRKRPRDENGQFIKHTLPWVSITDIQDKFSS